MLSKREAIQLHREMWVWLAEHPEAGKYDWPGWKVNGGNHSTIDNDCFLCEYLYTRKITCEGEECPLVWFPGATCRTAGSPYLEWVNTNDPIERAKFALQIANLPEKGGERKMLYKELYQEALAKVDKEERERGIEKIALLIRHQRSQEAYHEHMKTDLDDLLTHEVGSGPASGPKSDPHWPIGMLTTKKGE